MAKPGAANGSGASGLSPEELRLWRRVAETAEPLKRPRGAVRSSPASGPRPAPAPVRDATAGAADRTPAAAPGPRRAPPLAQIPAREARQIAGGRVGLDARVDLHGLRQQAAHAKLKLFLSDAQARGARTVLVITGKGGGEEADTPFGQTHDRGVLKLAVPRWLAEPEFRRLVVGFTRAHMRHGGAGAFYVRLRRPRRMP